MEEFKRSDEWILEEEEYTPPKQESLTSHDYPAICLILIDSNRSNRGIVKSYDGYQPVSEKRMSETGTVVGIWDQISDHIICLSLHTTLDALNDNIVNAWHQGSIADKALRGDNQLPASDYLDRVRAAEEREIAEKTGAAYPTIQPVRAPVVKRQISKTEPDVNSQISDLRNMFR